MTDEIKHYRFKEHMVQRAMELWGIQNRDNIDPIVELFIDVFAYEISKVHHEISISDNQLLDRLSRILVNKKWTLPTPAHALLSVEPDSEDEIEVSKLNRFYINKRIKGSEFAEIGFSAIYKQSVIKAEVSYLIYGQTIAIRDKLGLLNARKILAKADRFSDYELLVGVKIAKSLLQNTKLLNLCVLTNDISLSSYLSLVEVYTMEGAKLEIRKNGLLDQDKTDSHYIEDVLEYYSDYMYVVDIGDNPKSLKNLEDIGILSQYMDILDDSNSYFWLKLRFPEVFSQDALAQISVHLNAVPVVNRNFKKIEHNINSRGRIIPLKSELYNNFLDIESLQDNSGKFYCNIEDSHNDSRKGVFSLYFGKLEKFDNRSAKEIVDKALQALREEGSSFYYLDADNIESKLSSVTQILTELEQIIKNSDIDKIYSGDRAYLLTVPFDRAFNYGVEYWITNADLANGILAGTLLHPYKTDAFKESSVRLITDTVGGSFKDNENDRINSLRYGLLSKNRIVSAEDIKSFIKYFLGNRCKNIIIKNGVEISSVTSQGLIRTLVIEVTINDNLSYLNKGRLANFIEKAIEKKSVIRSNYRVKITN